MASKKISVEITVGTKVIKTDIKKGSKISAVLEANGVATAKKDVMLNGKPVGLNDTIEAAGTLRVSERPAGS